MGGLAKGLAVIEALRDRAGRLTIADAARAGGMSRAAARRCLRTLTELGYVAQDRAEYRPLPALMRLGAAYYATVPLPALAPGILASARDRLAESVSLAVLDGADVLFVGRAEASRIIATGVGIGRRLPAYCSATGRVLLAALSDAEVRARLAERPRVARTPRTLVALGRIVAAVGEARRDGYAISDEEIELGMRALAVAVRDATGTTVAAMSVSVPAVRIDAAALRTTFLPVLTEHARLLEDAVRLTGSPPVSP